MRRRTGCRCLYRLHDTALDYTYTALILRNQAARNRAMFTRLLCIRLLLLAMVLGWSTRFVAAQASQPVLAELPRETLGAVRLARIDAVDSTLLPLAKSFGVQLPSLGALASGFQGIDPSGEVVLGLVRLAKEEYVPFVLLPIDDYKTFVRAGDGDAGIPFTPITLAGEELLASERGRWALVTNPIEQFDQLGKLDSSVVQQIADMGADELLTAFLTPAGLGELQTMAQSRREAPHRLASRRARMASRSFNWTSLSEWDAQLTLHQAMIARFCKDCQLMAVNVGVGPNQSLAFDIWARAKRAAPAAAKQPHRLPEFTLSNQRTVFVASGSTKSFWAKLAIELSLDNISSGSDAIGVRYFSSTLFAKFRESAVAAFGKVRAAQAMMIAPLQDEPTLSNSALLLEVHDSAEFLKEFDACISDWNTAVERSSRQEDFLFETKPLQVGELAGSRYTIDLPSAVRDPNIPEVREVMARMYGRNGVWAVDVLPVDKKQVLISDLPDKLRDQLIDELESAEPSSANANDESSGQWTITLSPATLQDWRNDIKRQSHGEGIIGWKPKSLDCSSDVVVKIEVQKQDLHIEAEIPSDVVMALGELLSGE